jgi:DNA-binding response OmpR family regulator
MLDDDDATRRLDDQLRRERFAVDIVNSKIVGHAKSQAQDCNVIVLDSASARPMFSTSEPQRFNPEGGDAP